MLVTLICEDKLYGELLPEKVRGQYWIEDESKEITDPKRRLFSIEAEEGVWKIKARRRMKLYQIESVEEKAELTLSVNQMYVVEFPSGEKGYVFTETYTEDRCIFKKYKVPDEAKLSIGKKEGNQIVIDNPYVSNVHACLSLSGGTWLIEDSNSKNGVYVNGKRITDSVLLKPGDMVYIMGVKLVLGDHFVAMNNPDGRVRIQTQLLTEYSPMEKKPYEAPEEIPPQFYYRSPKFSREITPLDLRIDPPPSPAQGEDTPMILSIGPSLVMGLASLSTAGLAIVNAQKSGGRLISLLPTIIMSVSMMCGMIVFPFIIKSRDKKRKKEKEAERREKYVKYLNNIRAEIHKASVIQKEILNENFPSIMSQMREPDFYDRTLWSRVMGRENFLRLRVGVGNSPMKAELKFPEQRFGIDDDVMRIEVERFSQEKQILSGVPITYSLLEHRVSGIVGYGQMVNEMLHQVIMQIAALHSYDEVKLIFICDESRLNSFGYVRFLQHIWDNGFRIRFLATNPEEVRELSAYFVRLIERRRGDHNETCPHFVIISASKALSDTCGFLAELLKDETVQGFSYLAAYDELKNLPKECTYIIQAGDGQAMLSDYKEKGGGQSVFIPDFVSGVQAYEGTMKIGEYRLDLQSGKYALPPMLTFLDMFQVGNYEHLNIASRWKENNPVLSLRTPVGVNSDGGLFYLDLHEKGHGPHGLVAGMTGSGKSEFLITYILSLAVNYSPDDIAFILIDYKGGGLVDAFDNEQYRLPHMAGTITNLDGASISRSLLSIQSELRRRQTVFKAARGLADEGTMDIYKYQKLYRNKVVNEPMPHLLIISDEFAELKSQQPEFMAQLISTARIGRSLGVHLILATQKPSGVVNEQIWANSKFKICLKVQDRADSMDMLKRPDAAELVETGRFYLQVGYNELFEMGQSAWCGAPYNPVDFAGAETDEWVQMIDHQGNVVEESRPKRRTEDSGKERKQVVEIVKYITMIAWEEGKKATPLWLPEIPAVITIDGLEKKYSYQAEEALNPIIGELDDPFNQSQRLLTLPLTEKGNAICYGSGGSGTEIFLTAVLYSLYQHHSSDELNTYILDFGGETLGMFEEAPQTGGFVVSSDEGKGANLFHFLEREIKRRKRLFASVGGDYCSYRKQGHRDVPNVLVIINDYPGFSEQYEEISDNLPSLTRDCARYGIFFLLTCSSSMGIRYKLQQNFSQVFSLQLNDKSDYTSILGNTGGVFPSRIYGRGIVRDKGVYEFQTAYVFEKPEREADTVRDFCRALKKASGGKKAAPIPSMPRILHRADLQSLPVTFEQVPIGMRYSNLEPVYLNLRKLGVQQVLSMDRQELYPIGEAMAELVQRETDWELYVFDPAKGIKVEGIDEAHYITDKPEETVEKLFGITVERHNKWKRTGGDLSAEFDLHRIVVVLAGLGQVKKLLSEDGVDKLRLILEKNSGRFQQFYLVLDDYVSSNTYSREEWCRSEGLWVGNGVTDQIRFKINGRTAAYGRYVDSSSGFMVQKGVAEKVKYLVSDRTEVEDE